MMRLRFAADSLKGPSLSTSTAVKTRAAEREQIEADIAAYLESGGTIKSYDRSASGFNLTPDRRAAKERSM